MRNFSINLAGRIKNFNLPKNQSLIPLFEAIVNSIHAIDERKKEEPTLTGEIEIRIIRDPQTSLSGVIDNAAISSFEITDNGIGFNHDNFNSFMESDSVYKAELGGKGVGRFSWLIAFEKATVESVFKENNRYLKRAFTFSVEQNQIDDSVIALEGTSNFCKTTVTLVNCKLPYCESIPKRGSTIAMRIIQHCLIYFVSENCPKIRLVDDHESYDLNSIFKQKIQIEENKSIIIVAGEQFELLHVKSEEGSVNGNKLYLCAHNRLVETKNLDKYIVDLDSKIYERSGFWYIGVLRGKFLDDAVDMNRLSFNIPDGGSLESMEGIVTMDRIIKAVTAEVSGFLKGYLEPIKENKVKRITNYVTNKAPQFRHLMKYMPSEISEIKPDLSDDRLDDELYQIKRKFDAKTRQENEKLFDELRKGIINSDEYSERFKRQIERITSSNSAALAEYVAHRKVILNLMQYGLHKKDDGKFQLESFLHNLIYPMHTTSDEIPYNNHNLWLIDEKLAYSTYISSDVPFNNDHQEDRTDIMVLDNPVAISDEENQGREFESIVLFELKRPMRNNYKEGDNPITQLYRYVKKLQTNKVTDKNGRLIKVGANTRFYLYAVCDITSSLEDVLTDLDYTQTPDRMGYYNFNAKLNAYIEVLSYDKIVIDAEKRNKILFDKLGI